MKEFTDNADRVWTVEINVTAVKRVRDLLGVDLLSIVDDGKLLGRLTTEPVLLVDVIYVLCKPQADTLEVSDEDFGRAMGGDSLEAATTALLEELVAFFPTKRRRLLKRALAKFEEVETKVLELAEAKLDSPEVKAEIARLLATVGDSSGASPASSESTPAP